MSALQRVDQRRNVTILSFTLLVVMLGFGLVIPIIPYYMEAFGAGGTELGLLVASYAVMRLIFGPVWGSLSDRIGRKPVLMIGIFGYGVTMVLFGLATELWMLFAARILAGILSSATSPTTMAYIGDSTSEEERGRGMGVLGAAIGIGTILGPGVGGLLAVNSLAMPFFLAGGMSFLALLLVWWLLPESLPAAARQAAKQQARPSPATLANVLAGPMGALFFMAFLIAFATTSLFSIFGLYALEKFAFGPELVGGILMVVGLVSAVAQGVLVGPATKQWGELAVIGVTCVATAAGFALIALSSTALTFLAAVAFFTLATALLTPTVAALTSKRTTFEQGVTMGISNAYTSLGRIIGPLLAGVALDVAFELPMFLAAGVMLAGGLAGMLWLRERPSLTTAGR